MKTIKFMLVLVTLVISFSTCSENDPSDTLPPDESKPVGELKYVLHMSYLAKDVASDVLVDSAKMEVVLKDGVTTFSNFQNYAGNILPSSKTYPSGCTVTWAVDGFPGPLHVTAATGLYNNFNALNELTILFSGTTYIAASTVVCPELPDFITPAQSGSLSWPLPLKFDLNDQNPVYQDVVMTAKLIRQ